MKRQACLIIAVIALAWPGLGRAQSVDDSLRPDDYQDVNDAQLLKLTSYLLMPVGMGLEWGVTRPLHYLATQSVIAPLLSGDKDNIGFGEHNNAELVPPGTFDPAPMNLTDTYVPSPPESETSWQLKESIVPAESDHQSMVH